jgi:hypothetical protein
MHISYTGYVELVNILDNIKMDLQEVRCGVWTGLSWFGIDRWRALETDVRNLRVP